MKTSGSVSSYEDHVLEVKERRYDVKAVKTVVFGTTDGILIMFSFVAGITGAIGEGGRAVIILSGVVVLVVESLIMGTVQFLSDKTEKEVIQAWAQQESKAIDEFPEIEERELVEIYRADGFSDSTIAGMMRTITSDKLLWVKRMLLEELGLHLEKLRPSHRDAIIMAATTAVGGAVPLIPLLFGVSHTFYVMVIAASAALFALGAAKSYFTAVKWHRSAFETMVLVLAVAMACYAIGVGLHQLMPF